MKLCFSTLGCHDRTLKEIISVAKKFDMAALEIRGIAGELNNEKIPCFSAAEASETRKMLSDAKVRPLILGTSCTFHDPTSYESAIQEGYKAIEIAARIGFSAIRVFGDRITEDLCIARVANGVETLCRYAENFGVDVYLEVHGDFITEQSLVPITKQCGALARFGLIWDACHTRNTFPDPRRFYDLFATFIRHVHLKDIRGTQHVLPGDGEIPIKEITDYMTAKGYDGYFSLEWERKWHPELQPIEDALALYTKILK